MNENKAAPIDNKYPPLLLTYRQLEDVLWPYAMNDKWGRDTIRDLWKLGAPVPGGIDKNGKPKPPKRIILPSKLLDWLADVLERQGQPLDANAQIIKSIMTGEAQDAVPN